MTPASVTVVIPTFNCGCYVSEAIASVLAQSVPAEAVIVIDDGSTDDTAERLARVIDRVRYIRQPNRGVSAARNHGVREARTEFVAFLDADDVWHPRKLERQLASLQGRPELALVGTHTYTWPTESQPECDGLGTVVPVAWERLVVRNSFVTSSILARRSVLDRVGPFDTQLHGPEDYDLWLRVAEVAEVANLDLPLTGYRDVPGSLSKQARRMEADQLRILGKLRERRALRGRLWLRQKAYSMVYHQSAYTFSAAGSHAKALARSVQSLVHYPWPYLADERVARFERPKRLFQSLCRLVTGSGGGSPRLAEVR